MKKTIIFTLFLVFLSEIFIHGNESYKMIKPDNFNMPSKIGNNNKLFTFDYLSLYAAKKVNKNLDLPLGIAFTASGASAIFLGLGSGAACIVTSLFVAGILPVIIATAVVAAVLIGAGVPLLVLGLIRLLKVYPPKKITPIKKKKASLFLDYETNPELNGELFLIGLEFSI